MILSCSQWGWCGSGQQYSAASSPPYNSNAAQSSSIVWPLAGGQQLIKSQIRDNFCIDVGGWSTANGAGIQMWDCHGGGNQRWTYNSNEQTLRVQHSGKCLDNGGGNGVQGQKIHQWDCMPNNRNQQWIYNSIDRSIRWAGNTGLCLDVSGGSNLNGARLQLWPCGPNNNAQIWNVAS
jgi:hypothetical protein